MKTSISGSITNSSTPSAKWIMKERKMPNSKLNVRQVFSWLEIFVRHTGNEQRELDTQHSNPPPLPPIFQWFPLTCTLVSFSSFLTSLSPSATYNQWCFPPKYIIANTQWNIHHFIFSQVYNICYFIFMYLFYSSLLVIHINLHKGIY